MKRHNSSSRANLKVNQLQDEGLPEGIIAEADNEDDKLSDNSDTRAATKIVTQNKKNFLCKNLLE